MLIEPTLFGTIDKVALAIERIKAFEAQALSMHPDGYWVAFSGGKDSIVVLDLVRKAGVKHTAHFSVTTVDPPELLRYIRKYYPDVRWERPRTTMWKLIRKKMMPPTRIARYCCDEFKERYGEGRLTITGVRWAESVQRSRRRMVESCLRGKRKVYMHPILDWSNDDVWQYIRANEMPYCSLYDEGFKRIGCVGCPMARRQRKAQFARWPKFEANYRRAFAAAAADRNEKRTNEAWVGQHPTTVEWIDGDAMFDWWMNEDRTKPEDSDQGVLFE